MNACQDEVRRLRNVLRWAAEIMPRPCCESCGRNARRNMEAAADGRWDEVQDDAKEPTRDE